MGRVVSVEVSLPNRDHTPHASTRQCPSTEPGVVSRSSLRARRLGANPAVTAEAPRVTYRVPDRIKKKANLVAALIVLR